MLLNEREERGGVRMGSAAAGRYRANGKGKRKSRRKNAGEDAS